jgi:hypothetical protein
LHLKCVLVALLIASSACSRAAEPTAQLCRPETPLAGQSDVDGRTLDRYARRINPEAPFLGNLYVKIGDTYGIDPDVAFAQAFYETHAFTFGGDVLPSQNNFAGLGAIGEGASGASFDSRAEGVRAQIEHLYAYASTEELPVGDPIDPRFELVTRGSADTAEELSGKWAFPGYDDGDYSSLEEAAARSDTYGHLIAYIARDIAQERPYRAECDGPVMERFQELLDTIQDKVDDERVSTGG